MLAHDDREADSNSRKQQNTQFLESDTTHIDMYSEHLRFIRSTRLNHDASADLREERKHIKPYEYLDYLDTLNAEDLLRWSEEVDHATENHVYECVDPHWSEQDEDLSGEGKGQALLIAGSGRTEGEGCEFPGNTHDQDPAELLLGVMKCLEDVDEEADAEGDGENDGGCEGGIVHVIGVAGPFWDVAVFVGRYTDTF